MTADRVLIIGLDGGTWDVLNPLMSQGCMPHLAELVARSASGFLRSTIPPVTAAAWTSFATGKNPGQHGLVDFVFFPRHGYRVAIANSNTRQSRTLWELLGDQGKRVGVVNVPMSYPPTPVNGVMVTDMMTPNASVEYTYPQELKRELSDALGRFVITPGEGAQPSRPFEYLDQVLDDVAQSARHALYLLARERFDLFMYVFGVTDVMQHQFWHLLSARPAELTETGRLLREKLVNIYQLVDMGIGEMLKFADDNTLVVLMSDHGFGPLKGFLHVNNWLFEHGYLVFKQGALSRVKQAAFRLGVTPQNVHLLLKSLKLDLRRKVNRGRSYGLLRRFFLSFDDVDWTRTRAFALGHVGQIYINLSDRQPQGIVQPGEEYERLRDEIRAGLMKLRQPHTAEALMERVLNREEIYHGEALDDTPDLLLVPRDFEYVAFGESEFASNRIVGPALGHTGHHRLEGIGGFCGPDIEPGACLNDASLVDIAPTILHALGLAVPADMDGRVLTEAFTAESLSARRPRVEQATAARGDLTDGYSDAEEAEVIQRLSDLGYVS